MSISIMFLKVIRKLFFNIGFIYFVLKCEYFYLTQMGQGLSYVIENMPPRYIISILRKYGVEIGENCQIDSGLTIHRIKKKQDVKKLNIGNRVYIGHNMIFDLSTNIIIENDCGFGANCQIWTHVGDYTYDYTDYCDKTNPVTVKSGVVVYSGSIISQGITIGEYARVLAGSVVTRDIEAKSVIGGIPAKIIKMRDI